MTIPATLSIAIAIVGALVALATARISSGPGWRALAPFSVAAALAAIYAACDAVFTLPIAPSVCVVASRIGLFVAGLHGAAWFIYGAAQDDRALTRFERAMVVSGIAVGLIALVPGAFVSNVTYARPIPWLHVVYHDAYPTLAGKFCYAYYCFGITVLMLRYVAEWRRGVRGAFAHFVGLFALLLSGINDSLTTARVYDAPLALDVGFLVIVACVGTVLTSRFVESARSLEEQTAQLRATQAQLVRRERLAALGELSAVVAHEVRTPVSVMFNAVSVLRHRPPPAETESLITIVEEESHRLRRMVDHLLEFARPSTLQVARVDLKPVVASAVDAARTASNVSSDVIVIVRDDVPVIQCDEHHIREAIINLVTNALQASRRTEPVRVTVTRGTSRVRIEVSDDGVGVPVAALPRLFTPFFTTRPTGTGLGLAVVKRIAEAHNGEVLHRRTEGDGTTFAIVLPIDLGG